MDDKILASLLGVGAGAVAGAFGYWFTTFWMKPILQYRELRSKVLADLIFYAQVINADGLNERMKELYEDRVVSNRRTSAELAVCLDELPIWYLWWLRFKGHSPKTATTNLIGFSNTTEYDAAEKRIKRIRAALGIKCGDL